MSQNAALSCQNLLACCSTDLKCKQRFRQTGQQGSFSSPRVACSIRKYFSAATKLPWMSKM